MDIDKFLRGYMAAALWSSTDDAGRPLDDGRDSADIADECKAAMRKDCADFIAANADDLAEYARQRGNEHWPADNLAGLDFWLTRNGHGAGFWDRGLGALGDRLSEAAKVYGGVDLYVGDDDKVHA